MEEYALVISNPPHGDVDVNRADVSFLGLAPAEVRMKANYGVPEIWFADTDRPPVESAAEALSEVGLNVVLVEGKDLSSIPPQTPLKSFSFTDNSLVTFSEDESEIALRYDDPIVAVFCQAHGSVSDESSQARGRPLGHRVSHSAMVFSGRPSTGMAPASDGEAENPTFLDMYVSREGELHRLTVVQGAVDFSGLGEWELPGAAENMAMLVAECEQRFSPLQVDRRLVGRRIRERLTVGTKRAPTRKGYSFGTRALTELLGAISADLSDMSQPDLWSRLAYLTTR